MSIDFKRKDWTICNLEDVIEVKGGSQPPKSTFKYKETPGYIRLLQIRDFGKKPDPTFVPVDKVTKFCTKNDVLIARYGASLGRIVTGMEGAYNVALAKVIQIADSIFESRFVFFMLQTSILQQPLKMISRSAQNGFAKSDIAKIPLPIVPLPEQRAIVAKIEALFSDLDQGIADLKKAQAQLKVYRQAVLKKAFEGELTKEWRAQRQAQGPPLPTAEELLDQIKEERERHYKEQLEEWKEAVKEWEANGKDGKKPGRPAKLHGFSVDFEEKILKLPSNWKEGLLEYIADAIDPQPSHRTPPKVDGGVPYISIADIDKETGKINFDEARKVGQNVLIEHIERYKLKNGDFVIGKIGTIGKPFFIPTNRFFTLSANVVLVCPFLATCNPKYLFYLNLSPCIESQFSKGAKATTQAAFGIKKVRLLRVPLCSINEQNQIVKEIESRLSVCDEIEQNIAMSLQKAEALRQSILKQAFEGKLLSEEEIARCKQAPDYEQASVLLERIRAEKGKK